MSYYRCPYGYGWCKAPDGNCPHWQGTFCELDRVEDICDTCAYQSDCPSSHSHPYGRNVCADYRTTIKGR